VFLVPICVEDCLSDYVTLEAWRLSDVNTESFRKDSTCWIVAAFTFSLRGLKCAPLSVAAP